MTTTAEVVALRDKTGAGLRNCLRALEEFDNDPEQAAWFLRSYGQAVARRLPLRWPSEDANKVCATCGELATPCVTEARVKFWTPSCECGFLGLVPYAKWAARRAVQECRVVAKRA